MVVNNTDLLDVGHLPDFLALLESVEDVLILPPDFDLVDSLHRAQRLLPELSLVLDGHVAPLLQLEGRVDGEILAGGLSERLRPARLAGIALPLEEFVAFAAAEFEDFVVVAHELDAVAGVDRRRAKVTLFHAHIVFPFFAGQKSLL